MNNYLFKTTLKRGILIQVSYESSNDGLQKSSREELVREILNYTLTKIFTNDNFSLNEQSYELLISSLKEIKIIECKDSVSEDNTILKQYLTVLDMNAQIIERLLYHLKSRRTQIFSKEDASESINNCPSNIIVQFRDLRIINHAPNSDYPYSSVLIGDNTIQNFYKQFVKTDFYNTQVVGINIFLKKNVNNKNLLNIGYNEDRSVGLQVFDSIEECFEKSDKTLREIISIGTMNVSLTLLNNVPSKLKVKILNNPKHTLALYDSSIGEDIIDNKSNQFIIDANNKICCDLMIINQFGLKNLQSQFLYINYLSNSTLTNSYRPKILILPLINKQRITQILFRDNGYNSKKEATIRYKNGGKDDKTIKIPVIKSLPNIGNEYINILPISYNEGTDIFDKTISIIEEMIHFTPINDRQDTDSFTSLFNEYISTFLPDVNTEDPLIRWFKQATMNNETDEEKLLTAYKNLRKNLITEYNNTKIYMEHIDMSNKMPIPSINIEPYFKKNVEKKFAMNIISNNYNVINNIELRTPILHTNFLLSYLIPINKKQFLRGNVPLGKIYNKIDNQIIITKDTLKGDKN